MLSPVPTAIRRPQPYLLSIDWSDGFQAMLALRDFRDECPCALCKGENIMGTHYSLGLHVVKPGMYELRSLTAVGNYAISAEWNDGHNTGIYSWDILRDICQRRALSKEQLQELEAQAAKEP
jgi:DUF971 family protein